MSGSFLFRAKSREGFMVKLLAEYMSNILKYPPFSVNDKGIFLRATDQNREILIDLELQRENFTLFKCPKPLYFIVNSSHFYRLLKTIKKKDSVTMFINEQRPMQLGICVDQSDENSDKVTTYINITYIQPEDMDLPDGYGEPIIMTSKRFQKLKTLHSIGNEMKVTVIGNSNMKFFVNGKNLFSREISIGEELDDEEDQKSYTQTLTTSHITQLTKCAGQSGNIQVYHHEELPLQIKMRTGTLGVLSVYIKSHELIEQLEDEPEEAEESDQYDVSNCLAKVSIEDPTEEETEEEEVEEPETEVETEEDEPEEPEKTPPKKKSQTKISR